MHYFPVFDAVYKNNIDKFRRLTFDNKRRLMLKLIASAATTGNMSQAWSQSEGTLPEVTVIDSPEVGVAVDSGGIQWDDSGAPPDQFFSELNEYLRAAMETVDYYVDLIKKMLVRGAEGLSGWASAWGFTHQIQKDHPGRITFDAWSETIVRKNEGSSIAVTSSTVHASLPSAPIAGLYYWTFGNGATVTTPIESMALKVDLSEVGANGLTTNAVPLIDFINAHSEPGSYYYSSNPFGYSTYEDNWFTGKFIGNFSMQSEGVLTRNVDGSWDFAGSVKAAVPDRYDANRSDYRDPTNEDWTSLLRMLPGKDYLVDITGNLPINFNSR